MWLEGLDQLKSPMIISGIEPATFQLELRLDSLSNKSVVGQFSAGKKVSTEAENIVGIPHQTTTGEDTAECED
jgi:hypothetical protein